MTIAAPPNAVFEEVNDLRKWKDWYPWVRIGHGTKVIFEGPHAGTGASCRLKGNSIIH